MEKTSLCLMGKLYMLCNVMNSVCQVQESDDDKDKGDSSGTGKSKRKKKKKKKPEDENASSQVYEYLTAEKNSLKFVFQVFHKKS